MQRDRTTLTNGTVIALVVVIHTRSGLAVDNQFDEARN